ncbi:MarR family winged helix-turn-helix transcriptional regulator [Kineococcus indalonis]|uniref:MarR family winged helix-turn-helix transcriptional regulator n=1 Tax=Kineococcus indalonis TaxID=2696566 RepID=UPI0014135250|nr:MarR family transcriptional regulator [Kineococcus indalonis]NAZ84956.1 MarR family transcriptional regulator [Kineococcus indalonis]
MQLDEQLATRLLVACSELTRAATAAAAPTPLSPAQGRLLGTVQRRGPLRVSRLAALEGSAQPSTTALVARCADAGLLTRTTDPDDARAVLVSLTERGARALAEHRRALAAPLGAALAPLGEDGRAGAERAAALLDRLTAAVRDATPLPD